MRRLTRGLALVGLALSLALTPACSSDSSGDCPPIIGFESPDSKQDLKPTDPVLANLKSGSSVEIASDALWVNLERHGSLPSRLSTARDGKNIGAQLSRAKLYVMKQGDGLHVWLPEGSWWPATKKPVVSPDDKYLSVAAFHTGTPSGTSANLGSTLPRQYIKQALFQLGEGQKAYVDVLDLTQDGQGNKKRYWLRGRQEVHTKATRGRPIRVEFRSDGFHAYLPADIKPKTIAGRCGLVVDDVRVTLHQA